MLNKFHLTNIYKYVDMMNVAKKGYLEPLILLYLTEIKTYVCSLRNKETC